LEFRSTSKTNELFLEQLRGDMSSAGVSRLSSLVKVEEHGDIQPGSPALAARPASPSSPFSGLVGTALTAASMLKGSGSVASFNSGQGTNEQTNEDDTMSVASRDDGKRLAQKKSLKTAQSSRPSIGKEEHSVPTSKNTGPKIKGAPRTLRYPVKQQVPEQPRLALPSGSQDAWQERWDQAAGFGGSTGSKPPTSRLCWYGRELQQLCSQALFAALEQVLELKALQRANPEPWQTQGQLWPLLLEVSPQVFAASLVTDNVSKMLLEEGSSRGELPVKAPTALEDIVKLHMRCMKSEVHISAPAIRFKPHTAEDALSAMNAELTRLQATGQALGMTLRRLGVEWGETLVAEEQLRRLLSKRDEGSFSQLFLLVPSLELMLQKLRNLMAFVLRSQADNTILPMNEMHSLAREVQQEIGQETYVDVSGLVDLSDEAVPQDKDEENEEDGHQSDPHGESSLHPSDDAEEASASSPRRMEKKTAKKSKSSKSMTMKAKSKR